MRVYQVGGSVRDGLLGLPVADRDWVVVGATPEDMGRAQASRTAAYGPINADTLLTIAHTPQDIAIIVAGGAGAHTVYIPCFGNTRSVTRAIE